MDAVIRGSRFLAHVATTTVTSAGNLKTPAALPEVPPAKLRTPAGILAVVAAILKPFAVNLGGLPAFLELSDVNLEPPPAVFGGSAANLVSLPANLEVRGRGQTHPRRSHGASADGPIWNWTRAIC